MFFFFTCGTHTFTSRLKGAENLTVQCQNCGNYSAHVVKRWEWFTFCFVPIIPFSLKPYKEVGCGICNFFQDIKYRPDVQAQLGWNGGQQGGVMMGAPGQGPPPPQHPQYK
jgi:ssDNA-binding Zn-finger/Zn-ribbon topoisomerase 1